MDTKRTPFCIIEDHVGVAEAISFAIEATHHMRTAGSFNSLKAARAGLVRCNPRVVVVDWRITDGTGPTIVAEVKAALPECRWLLYTATPDAFVLRAAINAGIHGAVSKGAPLDVLLRGVRETADGHQFFCPEATRALQSVLLSATKIQQLNDTEIKLIRFIADGMEMKDAAFSAGIATKTAHNYLTGIREKLGCASMVDIATWAIRHGLAVGE